MKNEHIFDEWGDDSVRCQAIAIYEFHPGTRGDYDLPSERESVEIIDIIYRIRTKTRLIDVPANDYHTESLDWSSLEDACLDDYNSQF